MSARVPASVVASVAAAVVVGLVALGCGGASHPRPTAPPDDLDVVEAAPSTSASPATEAEAGGELGDADLERSMRAGLDFIDELADAATAAGAACPAVATAINGAIDRHATTIATLARYENDPALRQRSQGWLQRHQPEIAAASLRLATALAPCPADPAVEAALARLTPP